MLRTRNVQPSLGESVLPEVCLRLPAELARVDGWLHDDRFFAPFRTHFDARLGRPSVPMGTYLRLMFLKHRYRLGYETLCAEVADSISWRRFCRIDIDGTVPHPTTLMKITTRCGEDAVAAFNEVLLAKAVEHKLVKTGMVRADTTVVSANIEYPADAPQLAPAIARIKQRTGKTPRRATADRGYGEVGVDEQLPALGVKTVAIPRKEKTNLTRRRHEHKPAFRKLVKWRTGCEGRISHLKHRYGCDRTRLDGLTGAWTWVGHGILVRNLVKITNLAAR